MDWQNERYVRVYTRDTKTWLKLGWEAQALLGLVMRKLDRSGVLDDVRDAEDLSVMLGNGMPLEIIRVGLDRLMKHEVFVLAERGLFMPHFAEAQEASKSDRQRQRESRERRRELFSSTEEVMSQNVTSESRNVTPMSQNVMVLSQPVTTSHELSQPVTPTSAVPCCAVPDQIQPDHTHSRPDRSPAREPVTPEPEAPPAASQRERPKERPRDRFTESFAGPSQAATELFEAWKTAAAKPNAAFDARRRELFERLVIEGVTVATVRDVVAGAKLDEWARERALSPAIVLGTAEQREKYQALAKAPRKPPRGGPPQPNDPNPSTRWRPSRIYGPGRDTPALTVPDAATRKAPTPPRGAGQDTTSGLGAPRTTRWQPNPSQNARDPGGLILRPLASTMSLRAFSLSAGGLDG